MSADTTPPAELLDATPERARAAVVGWWRGLSEDARAEVACALEVDAPISFVLLGDLENEPEDDDPARDLREYIQGNAEVSFFLEEREFRICRDHAPAQRVLANGDLPAGFRCSHRGDACPWVVVSKAAGRARVVLRPVVRVGCSRSGRDA